jgi:RNA polymerase sigma-70 factor (ECF subfamily)
MCQVKALTGLGADEAMTLAEHGPDVFMYLRRRLPDDRAALASFKEAMVRAWAYIDQIPPADVRRQRIWLLMVASHVLRAASTPSEGSMPSRGSTMVAPPRDRRRSSFGRDVATLRGTIPRLSYVQREMVTLVHWDGLTLREAAEVLGLRLGAAERGYSAGRANLRATLEGARV